MYYIYTRFIKKFRFPYIYYYNRENRIYNFDIMLNSNLRKQENLRDLKFYYVINNLINNKCYNK